MSLTRKWSLLTAVLVVAIFAAGWFLLVGPKRSDAADLRAQAGSQEQQNAQLVQKLEVLKAQQADLPKQRAQLATYRMQIPDNPALPSLIRDLTASARKVGASLDELAPTLPVAAAPLASSAGLPQASTTTGDATSTGASSTDATSTDATSTDATSTDATSTDAATATGTSSPANPAPQAGTLYQVPLAVTVSGSYFELEQFVNRLEGLKRSFLVKGFELKPADASDGAAPSALTLTVQGQVFLAPQVANPVAKPSPAASASAAE